MIGIWHILISLAFASAVQAAPLTDPYVKNLTLVGVIHVQGSKAKGQSVAVLREKSSGRTRILHKGDSIADADLEVRELGPQHITLARGQQTFVLRVENFPDHSTELSDQVESAEAEIPQEKSSSTVVELPLEPETNQDKPLMLPPQTEQRRLIPDADCVGDECAVAE
jgi:hypothetical protein